MLKAYIGTDFGEAIGFLHVIHIFHVPASHNADRHLRRLCVQSGNFHK